MGEAVVRAAGVAQAAGGGGAGGGPGGEAAGGAGGNQGEARRAGRARRAAGGAAGRRAVAPTVDAATVDLKPLFSAVIAELGVDDLSAKVLREKVEAKLGLAAGALKPRREEIKAVVEEIMSEHEAAAAAAKERKAAMRRETDAGLQASAATGAPPAPSAVKEWAQGGLATSSLSPARR